MDTKVVFPKSNKRMRTINILCFSYVLTAIGLVGIPGYSRLALFFGLLLSIVVLLGVLQRRLRVGQWIILPLVFYTYAIALAFESPGGWGDLGPLFTVWVGSAAVGIAVQNGASKKFIIYAGAVAILSSFIANLYGFEAFNEYSTMETGLFLTGRASGLMGNPNYLAIAAGTFAFLSLALLKGHTKLKMVLSASCFYAVILSASRKGLAGLMILVVLILLYPLFYMPKFRKKYVVALTVVAIGLAIFGVGWIVSYGVNLDAIERTLAISRGERSFEYRIDYIKMGWDLFLANPVLGYGLDSFRVVSGTGQYSHNNFIELLVNGGLIFFLLFYAHYFVIIKNAWALLAPKRYWVFGFSVFLLAQDMAMISYQSRAIVLALILLLVECRKTQKKGLTVTVSTSGIGTFKSNYLPEIL